MPTQFLSGRNGFTRRCALGRRLWTSPTGRDWCGLLYFNLPNPDMPFVGYEPEPYPGGYPPYTRAQWYASQFTASPLPALAMYRDEFEALLEEGQKYLGYPYLWGGKNPPYFDCSGFVGWCFKTVGLLDKNVISYTGTLWRATTKVESPYFGDMVFWNGSKGNPDGSNAHVEIFLGWKETNLFYTIGSAGGGVKYRVQTTTQKSFNGFYRIPAR